MIPQKVTAAQLKAFKLVHPERFAELEAKAVSDHAATARRTREFSEEQARIMESYRSAGDRFRTALISWELPSLDFLEGVHGIVAQRAWHISNTGMLESTAMRDCWKGVMVADRIPTDLNEHGLYCNALSPSGMMLSSFKYVSAMYVQGVVECRGIVEEHSDGVLRAEWARILCLVVLGKNSEVYKPCFDLMRKRYFPIPVYVLTDEQYAEFLFRLMVVCRQLELTV